MNTLWNILLIVSAAGAIGGLINALISDNGFVLPKREIVGTATTILRPGWLGNVLIGAVAAVVSWGLYGPLSSHVIAGKSEITDQESSKKITITLAAVVGATLIGVGGARWLTNEVDKKLLKAAASVAAGAEPKNTASTQMASASPMDALRIAKKMAGPN